MSLAFSLVAAAVCASAGCREAPSAAFTDLMEGRREAADLRVQFTKMSDASDRAVMADSDQASSEYVKEAHHLKGFVSSDVAALEPRLQRLRLKEASDKLDAFERQFAEYDKVDQEVLRLAGENTNLKAQRLSFGPARAEADALRDSLRSLAVTAPVKDRCRVEELAATAIMSVREIQVLHAPHIAEREDAAMTALEKQMAALDTAAKDALTELAAHVDAKAKPALANATAALERFEGVSKEIVTLSRRNTNVVSLDLALRRKPALAAACDESLRALAQALAKDPFPATK